METASPVQKLDGKYEILDKIAEGGMGSVYRVRHRLLEEIRVVKVLRPQLEDQQELRERFLNEARTAIRMRHVNIAQLYDCSMDDEDNVFIVMEYIDGVTLQDLLEGQGPPSVAMTLEIAQQTLLALAYLHRKGVVHRDISPDNLMVSADEAGRPLMKLIDLGIAKTLKADRGLTATGMFLGKVRYASPEQFRAEEGVQVTHTSDLYSLGVVLYELLTGHHPVAGSDYRSLITGHLLNPPRPFSETDPKSLISEDLRTIVLTALAKPPEDRFATSDQMRDAILALRPYPGPTPEETTSILRVLGSRPATAPLKPGTTQKRLDSEFNAQSTQASEPTDPNETPPPLPAAVVEMVAVVEQLIAADRFDRARELVEDGIARHGDVPDLIQLRAHILAVARKRRAAVIDDVVEAVKKRIAEGNNTKAAECAREAIARLGGVPELEAILERIDQPKNTLPLPANGGGDFRQQPVSDGSPPLTAGRGIPRYGVAIAVGIVLGIVLAGTLAVVAILDRSGLESDPSALTSPSSSPRPTGTLVIKAVPWAEILKIVNSDQINSGDQAGEEIRGRYTPLGLTLEPGHYRVLARHPEAPEQWYDIEVRAGQTSHMPIRARDLNASEILARYGL